MVRSNIDPQSLPEDAERGFDKVVAFAPEGEKLGTGRLTVRPRGLLFEGKGTRIPIHDVRTLILEEKSWGPDLIDCPKVRVVYGTGQGLSVVYFTKIASLAPNVMGHLRAANRRFFEELQGICEVTPLSDSELEASSAGLRAAKMRGAEAALKKAYRELFLGVLGVLFGIFLITVLLDLSVDWVGSSEVFIALAFCVLTSIKARRAKQALAAMGSPDGRGRTWPRRDHRQTAG